MSHDSAKVEIRELRVADLAAVIALAESLEQAPRWPAEVYRSILDQMQSGQRIALVAQDSPSCEVLGFAVVRLIGPEAELESIAVATGSQRSGLGRKLLTELEKKLVNAGVDTIHLEVRASNQPALGLYKSFGFREIGQRRGYYANPAEDAILLARAVPLL